MDWWFSLHAPEAGTPFQPFYPISEQVNSRESGCYQAKKTLSKPTTNKVKRQRVTTIGRGEVEEY